MSLHDERSRKILHGVVFRRYGRDNTGVSMTTKKFAIPFQDRHEAGRALASRLKALAGKPDFLILALPRGGVPVAFEIAFALGAPLDVFLVRKLGMPGYEDLALGAIASGGVCVFNDSVVVGLGVTQSTIDAVIKRELPELERREASYRRNRLPLEIAGRRVILVDDGMATGATMRAAVKAVKSFGPKSVAVAVPVAAKDSLEPLRRLGSQIVCLATHSPFFGVGEFYRDFEQVSDEEVLQLLNEARSREEKSGGTRGDDLRTAHTP